MRCLKLSRSANQVVDLNSRNLIFSSLNKLGFRSLVTSCRAVVLPRFGGPEVLEIREDAQVPALKPNEVLVRSRAVSVNPLDLRVVLRVKQKKLNYILLKLFQNHKCDVEGAVVERRTMCMEISCGYAQARL